MTVQALKVKLVDNEIRDYVKSIEIEYQGVIYFADLSYHIHDGYQLQFQDAYGENIPFPDWAENYDNAQRSIEGDLDTQSGSYQIVQEGEEQ